MINRDLKNAETKLISWCAANKLNRRDWIIRLCQNEKKIFISKALLVALKKDLRLSSLYSDLEICWANFKALSRIQVAARALKIGFMRKTTVAYVHHFFGTFLWHSLRAFSPCKDICVNLNSNWANGSTYPPKDALRKNAWELFTAIASHPQRTKGSWPEELETTLWSSRMSISFKWIRN